MKTFIAVVLTLALATLVPLAYAKEPSSYPSLQPYQTFSEGAGHGLALEYVPRDKAQFAALLRDKSAKKRMRVGCEVLVRQMAEVHGLPFEGCEGAAAAIEGDSDYAVVSCKDDMFVKANYLAVTNDKGTAFGVWHRKCLPREQVLLYKGRPIVSTTCLNVAVPVLVTAPIDRLVMAASKPADPVRQAVVTGTKECPAGYRMTAYAWSMRELQSRAPDIARDIEKRIAIALERDTKNATNPKGYEGDAVSRDLGLRLRKTPLARAQSVNEDLQVRIRDSRTARVVGDLGPLHLKHGFGSISLPARPTHILETVWPGNFISPTISGGEPRIWLFEREWGNHCNMNVHGIVP